MPEIDDAELQRLRGLESGNVALELQLAKERWLADPTHNHIPRALIDSFQGSADQIKAFGDQLLASIPQPQPGGGQPAPVAPQADTVAQPNQQPAALPNPADPNSNPTPPPNPAGTPHPASQTSQPTTPPMMAQPVNPWPNSPLQQQQMYQQQMAQVVPYAGGMQPVPQPGMASQVTQQNAREAQTQQVRERMAAGIATRQEVEWIAQWGSKGFVSAMQNHAADVRQSVGGRNG
jgi:hypothetical protein